ENVRSAGQGECGKEAAVRAAPRADPLGIHFLKSGQVLAGTADIIEFARARRSEIQRLAKVGAIADAAPKINGKNDIALIYEKLVEAVGVRVILAIVPG